jgi:catabolite regulation protein CreA
MLKTVIISLLLIVTSLFSEKIAEHHTSGFMFSNKVELHVFDDPSLDGVSCYYTESGMKSSFGENSEIPFYCIQFNNITGILENKTDLTKDVKDTFFENMGIDRVYDKKRNSLIYFSYGKKKKLFKNAISVIQIKKF